MRRIALFALPLAASLLASQAYADHHGRGMGQGMGHGQGMGQGRGMGHGHGPRLDSQMLGEWDLNNDDQVTLEEVVEGRENRFMAFDYNEDGFIDAEEITYMQDMHATQHPNNQRGGPSIGRLDGDGDGRVSRDEFVNRAARWFASRDRNRDDVLNAEDFSR